MSRLRERTALLDALPRRYRKEPAARAILNVINTRADPVTLEVRDQTALVVTGTETLRCHLGSHPPDDAAEAYLAPTFLELEGWFATVGLAASFLDIAALAVNPATLLDDGPVTLAPLASHTLLRWTQGLWRLFDPAAIALVAAGHRISIALAQLNLLTAAGDFAEFWGTLTSTVRRVGESDEDYTARQLHELLRPRSNNEALAMLLEEDFGVPVVEVRDLEPVIFRCSATPMRTFPLVGKHFNACTAEVIFDGVAPPGADVAAATHVAGGIRVIVRDTLRLFTGDSPYYIGDSPYTIDAPPAMKINHPDGTIGIGKIGPP